MRWIFRIVAVLALLLVVVVGGLLMLPGDKIAQVAVDQLRAQTGRDVVLKGETRISYYPVLGVATGALEIANADWSDNGPLLQADALKVGVDFGALLSGDIKIVGLEAVNPVILLERSAAGQANWELGVEGVSPSGQPSGSSNALALSLDRALITGGQLRYVDHSSGQDLQVEGLGLDLKWPAYRGQADFAMQGQLPDAAPLELTGTIGDLAALIEGEITTVSVAASTTGGTLSFDGRFGTPVQAQGHFKAELPDTSAFLAALGQPGLVLPAGGGQSLTAQTDVTLTADMRLSLRELVVMADQNQLGGELDLDLRPDVPVLTAKLVTNVLELPGSTGASSADGAAEAGWSKAAIDASALGLMNADVAVTLEGLRVGGLSFGRSKVLATIDRARAVLELQQLAGYQGNITGQFVANNRNGLSVGGNFSVQQVELQNLLSDLIGVDRFTGQTNGSIKFLGVGQSIDAIMHSLSGDGQISMGRGTIQGIDLDSLMRTGLPTGGTTVFDAFSASFDMQDGVLTNNDLLLELPIVSASGQGQVGLGAQTIGYLFTPKTAAASSSGGVAIPVRIQGPWAAPKVRPDLEKAIDLNLQAEKQAAKSELEEKVKAKLGIEQGEDESLEDAAKRTLENEVLKGLGKIFQ